MGSKFAGLAKFGIAACFAAALAAFSVLTLVPVMSYNSINGTFNVTENAVFFNWTGPANITLNTGVDYTRFAVDNASTWIFGSYWQNDSAFYGPNSYSNLTETAFSYCFAFGSITGAMGFAAVNNVTGNQSSWNFTGGANSTLFNLTAYQLCPAGRYYGNFSVREVGNSSEYVNVTATVLIPLSAHNSLNLTGWNYTGFIHGKMPPNATYFHSYYFNPDNITNATSLTVNISGFNQTIGAYLLFPNGTVLAQAENSSSIELPSIRLNGSVLPNPSSMLELRIYGNFSNSSLQNYHANLFFTTVNVTNDTNQTVSVLDFGALGPNNTSASMNFTLVNAGGRNLTGVNQTSDFYWFRRWANNTNASQAFNGTQSNFSITVPNFTQAVVVKLEWSNATFWNFSNVSVWDIYLVDPRGRIVANASGLPFNSNFSNATVTKSLAYSGAFNSSNAGIWNITVNNSLSSSNVTPYNVSVYVWFNSTVSWISTNFTGLHPFNQLSAYTLANYSRYVMANITVPMTQLLNGTYEGYVQYSNTSLNGEGWKVRVPLMFHVSVPVIVVNSSLYNTTAKVVENTGFFRKRAFNMTISNAGGSAVIYSIANSSNLTLGGSFMNFTIDSAWLNASGGIIQASENRTINVMATVNTTGTGNSQGLYTGWITFNITQNSTNNISVHNIFNISLEVNLTNNLVVNITEYQGYGGLHNPLVNVTDNSSNITMLINVSLQNGTVLSNDVYLLNKSYSNFVSASMTEGNVTTHSATLTNIRDGDTIACKTGGLCMVNATVPANLPGGRYNLSLTVQWNSTGNTSSPTEPSPVVLTGSGGMNPLTIWAPGLRFTSVNSSVDVSMGEYIDVFLNASIINYGPKTADSGIISMNNSCSYVVVNASSSGNINGTCTLSTVAANNHFTISSIPGNGSGCWVAFKLHSINVSGAKSCSSGSINVTTSVPFFNYLNSYTVSISDTDGGGGGTGTPAGGGGTTTTTTYNRSVRIMTYNSAYTAKLGENISAAVTVKNTGNTTSIVWLSATTNNSAGINTSVSPSFASISQGNTSGFTVYMNVSNASRLGLFSGTFKAYVEGYTDTWYDSKSFDFTVEASAERRSELNLSYENYTAQLENLTAVFNAIKAAGFADAGNLTRVGLLLNDTTRLIEDIRSAINQSNYASAESFISELAAGISRLRSELSVLQMSTAQGEDKFRGDLITWAAVGIVIAGAAGVVIYMLLQPSRGRRHAVSYKPGAGASAHAGGRHVFGRLAAKLRRKEKGSAAAPKSRDSESNIRDYAELRDGKIEYLNAKYAEGYERDVAAGRPHPRFGRLGSVFRRSHQRKLDRFLGKRPARAARKKPAKK